MKPDLVKLALVSALAFLLQGCFVSTAPVLKPADAVYPFKSISFKAENTIVTLTRKGDDYRNLNDDDSPNYLFYKIEDGVYVGQAAGKDKKGRLETLYGLVLFKDKKAEILLPTCSDADEADLKAAGIEKKDKWFIDQCQIKSLDQMKALWKQIRNKDVESQVLEIKSITK
jgi:hypothetical protein